MMLSNDTSLPPVEPPVEPPVKLTVVPVVAPAAAAAPTGHPSITVCMTAFNEEGQIGDTLSDVAKVLDALPGEHTLLVVDDGSHDRTGEIVRARAGADPRIRLLVHPENRGVAHALRWLIAEAPGDVLFHLASDGEWSASELFGMLDKLNEGYDIVIGVRTSKHYTLYRKIVSRCYNLLIGGLFGTWLGDAGSIRIARAARWKPVPADSNSAFFVAEKLLTARRSGCRIGLAPVAHRWRKKGTSSFNNPLKALVAFRELIAYRLSPRSFRRVELPER